MARHETAKKQCIHDACEHFEPARNKDKTLEYFKIGSNIKDEGACDFSNVIYESLKMTFKKS